MACANSKLVASATPLPTDKNIHSTTLKPLLLYSFCYVTRHIGALFDQAIAWSGLSCRPHHLMVRQLGGIS